MEENYTVACARHFQDGQLLRDNGRTENALCHYAFSAECAMKLFYNMSVKKPPLEIRKDHKLENKWNRILENWDTLGALDARFQELCPDAIPPKLFLDHPDRRYYDGFPCTERELRECAQYASSLLEQVVANVLDNDLDEGVLL